MEARAAAESWDRAARRARGERDFAAAGEAYDALLPAAGEAGDPRLLSAALLKAGRFRLRMGRIQSALGLLEAGLRALAGQDPGLARQLDGLRRVGKAIVPAVVSRSLDLGEERVEAGGADYERPLAELARDPLLEAELLAAVGDAYQRMGQATVALSRYRQADRRALAARAGPARVTELRGRVAANRALALRTLGRSRAAMSAANRAIRWLTVGGDRGPARRAIATRAALLRDAGERAARAPRRARAKLAESERLFQESIGLAASAGDGLGEARASSNLALLYLIQARWPEAEAACRAALRLAADLQDPETEWHAGWGLGRGLLAQGRLAEAAEALRAALAAIEDQAGALRTEEGRLSFREARRGAYATLVEVLATRAAAGEPGAWAEALAVSEEGKGRVLTDLLRGLGRRRPLPGWRPTPPGPGGPRDGTDREGHPTPSGPADPEQAPGIPLPEAGPDIRQMAPGIPLPEASPDIRQMAPGIPLPDVETGPGLAAGQAPAAGPGPPRLAYHLLPSGTVVFFVDGEGGVDGRLLRGADPDSLAAAIASVRRGLGSGAVRGMRGARVAGGAARGAVPDDEAGPAAPPGPALAALYELLVAPFAERLPEQLVIEPDGPLWQLPFAALGPAGGPPLVARCALLVTPSLALLEEIRAAPDYGSARDLPALLVGNPAMPRLADLELDPLPGAEAEVVALEAVLAARGAVPTQRLTGAAASKGRVLAAMAGHGILHLATHGLALAEDPMASFVVLAANPGTAAVSPADDCLVTARELAELALPADLVVLSACQTGLGVVTSDGIIGLSRALLVAGARGVVVSLWNVDDAATARLMTRFYEGYLATDDKAAALAAAMRALRADPATADPRCWAGFYLVGPPR